MLDKRMRAASREFVPKARFVVDEDGMFVRWKIILPIETLIDILSFCSRRILSKRMRLVNRQFMRICNENIHSLGTVFNLIVSTSYRYGWATRVQDCILDYVRDFIELHCCMPSKVRRLHNHQADPEPSSFIPGSRDRVVGVETKLQLFIARYGTAQASHFKNQTIVMLTVVLENSDSAQKIGKIVKSDVGFVISAPKNPEWKAMELFWYKEPKLTPAEFYRFMQTNRYVRFANLKFENVQEECVIEFFKYLIETTEMFDHCRFFVKFKHTPKRFKAKAQVVHVQIPLDGERSRKKGVFEEHDSRNVNLDEFIPVNSLE
ncbi:hypothetical protein Ddc_16309 [Ditylenchus destructor]|nr:hypothetical protein Ddc_16309 [Ditylenchus destructor]